MVSNFKNYRLERGGYHTFGLFETQCCPTCGQLLPYVNYDKEFEECSDCANEWLGELIPDDTASPEDKQGARLTANARHPISHGCSIDDCVRKGERHHFDYSKPTEIMWLCRKHHAELHRKLKAVRRK